MRGKAYSSSIIKLQETAPNIWKASYRGNYGIYTIKIETDGEKTIDFSCSCPSDYYPCKHIPLIEEEIRDYIAESGERNNESATMLEDLLKNIPQEELCDFFINQAKYNTELKNAILLKFAHKALPKDKEDFNKPRHYSQILREALNEFDYDDETYWDDYYGYHNQDVEIEILDEWLNKAQEFADENNAEEAISICKACIEEFASWYENRNTHIEFDIDIPYRERPFEILDQTLSMKGVNHKALFDYCKTEMGKPKYEETEIYDNFSELLMKLSLLVGSGGDFIDMLDKRLQEIQDNDSYEAKKILQRKIDFYRNNNQPDEAWDVIKNNLQIESFRKEWTEKLIAEKNFPEAKRLVKEIISESASAWQVQPWYELKLQIAQAESDIQEIRRISFHFIENTFDRKHYDVYKSTFSEEEWPERTEELIQHYEKRDKNNWRKNAFNSSVAEILKAEKQAERLMNYIESDLCIDYIERYYTEFSSPFPEETLALFKQAVDDYAERNTGDESYNRVVRAFKNILKIDGGNRLVQEMINQYKILYKRRKNMIKIMDQFVHGQPQ